MPRPAPRSPVANRRRAPPYPQHRGVGPPKYVPCIRYIRCNHGTSRTTTNANPWPIPQIIQPQSHRLTSMPPSAPRSRVTDLLAQAGRGRPRAGQRAHAALGPARHRRAVHERILRSKALRGGPARVQQPALSRADLPHGPARWHGVLGPDAGPPGDPQGGAAAGGRGQGALAHSQVQRHQSGWRRLHRRQARLRRVRVHALGHVALRPRQLCRCVCGVVGPWG